MLGCSSLAWHEHLEGGQDGELLLRAPAHLLGAEDGDVVDDQHRRGTLPHRERQDLLDLGELPGGPGLPEDRCEQLGPVGCQVPGVLPLALARAGLFGGSCHPRYEV